MKRLKIVLIIGLICSLAIGCSSGEIKTLKEQKASLEEKLEALEEQNMRPASWYKSEEFSIALKLLDEFFETNSTQLGIAKTDTLQLVKFDKISDRYFLAAYIIAPIYPVTNSFYALVDMDKESCIQINLETIDYIKEITYDKDSITFYCDGQNVVNGFRDFPHNIKYDIAKNKISKEYLYYSFQHTSWVDTQLGNGINEVGLDKITENNKSILFSFKPTDSTLLAGGGFCPRISTGVKLDSNQQDRVLYVSFESLVLSKEAEKQIMGLKALDYMLDISIREYKDLQDIPHVAVYFKFKDMKEYSCSFKENSSNGFMDFELKLR
jgi:hypothetical protein